MPQENPAQILPPALTDKELDVRSDDLVLLGGMAIERARGYDEIDGMTPMEYYDSNKKKDLSFLPPKKNDTDVRITSGFTREKDNTVLSTMLDMNFVPDVTAFENDNLIVAELGDNLAAHVKKSREVEVWGRKRPDIYRELIAQGDVFVRELWLDEMREVPMDELVWDPKTDNVSEFTMRTRLKCVFSGPSVQMVPFPNIFLGSMRISYIDEQESFANANMLSRATAFAKYGTWDRWKNVPRTVDTQNFTGTSGSYQTWNISDLGTSEDKVCEVILWTKKKVQIYLNGTPMLPANFPLSYFSPSLEFPWAQGKFEPIAGFALGKGQPTKLKVDQEVHDEVSKVMVEKFRQGAKPAMGSRRNRVYAKDMLAAGKMNVDVREGDVFPLLADRGITASDYNYYNMIKLSMEEKSVNKAFEGQTPSGDPTLGQIRSEKQQQMLKLGLALDGVVNLERRMTWLRLDNIVRNSTKKFDPDMDNTRAGIVGKYRDFTVDTTLEDGKKGMKMFRYTLGEYPNMASQLDEEKKMREKYGKEVRIVYMDPEMLQAMRLMFFIVINPTVSSNDELTQILFLQNVRQGYELFGVESFNQEYLKQRYSILINEDFNKMFKKMDVMQMIQTGQGLPQGGNQTGNGMMGGANAAGGARKKPMQVAVQ